MKLMENRQQLQFEGEKGSKMKQGTLSRYLNQWHILTSFSVTFQFEAFHFNMHFHHLGYSNYHYH